MGGPTTPIDNDFTLPDKIVGVHWKPKNGVVLEPVNIETLPYWLQLLFYNKDGEVKLKVYYRPKARGPAPLQIGRTGYWISKSGDIVLTWDNSGSVYSQGKFKCSYPVEVLEEGTYYGSVTFGVYTTDADENYKKYLLCRYFKDFHFPGQGEWQLYQRPWPISPNDLWEKVDTMQVPAPPFDWTGPDISVLGLNELYKGGSFTGDAKKWAASERMTWIEWYYDYIGNRQSFHHYADRYGQIIGNISKTVVKGETKFRFGIPSVEWNDDNCAHAFGTTYDTWVWEEGSTSNDSATGISGTGTYTVQIYLDQNNNLVKWQETVNYSYSATSSSQMDFNGLSFYLEKSGAGFSGTFSGSNSTNTSITTTVSGFPTLNYNYSSAAGSSGQAPSCDMSGGDPPDQTRHSCLTIGGGFSSESGNEYYVDYLSFNHMNNTFFNIVSEEQKFTYPSGYLKRELRTIYLNDSLKLGVSRYEDEVTLHSVSDPCTTVDCSSGVVEHCTCGWLFPWAYSSYAYGYLDLYDDDYCCEADPSGYPKFCDYCYTSTGRTFYYETVEHQPGFLGIANINIGYVVSYDVTQLDNCGGFIPCMSYIDNYRHIMYIHNRDFGQITEKKSPVEYYNEYRAKHLNLPDVSEFHSEFYGAPWFRYAII